MSDEKKWPDPPDFSWGHSRGGKWIGGGHGYAKPPTMTRADLVEQLRDTPLPAIADTLLENQADLRAMSAELDMLKHRLREVVKTNDELASRLRILKAKGR